MKKLMTATLVVALFGIFTVFATSCGNKEKCNTNCCKTEECRTNCINSGCCEEGKTCDVNDHKDCKHKCCDAKKETCHIDDEKASCCKTKK